MVHRNTDEGHQEPKQRGKARGRPFEKGHTPKTKSSNKVLDDSGRKSGDSRGVVAPEPRSLIVEPKMQDLSHPPEPIQVAAKIIEPESTVSLQVPVTNEAEKDDQIMDKIEFTNGENKLSIRFSKKHNRMFRIQIFLNDESEIRPVTYTGASTGYAFWNLLKGALKK
jgi:hypothetical protein